MTMDKTWITVDELRNRLSISKNKAYQIAASGAIENIKIGRSIRISEESLAEWLESLKRTRIQGGDDETCN